MDGTLTAADVDEARRYVDFRWRRNPDRDDIFVDCLVALWRCPRPNLSKVCMRNAVVDGFRRRLGRRKSPEMVPFDDVRELIESRADPWDPMSADEYVDRVADPRLRQVLSLIAAGFTQREVAEQLGVHESRVSQLLRPLRRT